MEELGEATAAGCGAVVSSMCLYPVNKVKMVMQAERREKKEDASTFGSAARRMVQNESMANFFAGSTSLMTKSFINNFVFYYCFAALRRFVFGVKKGVRKSMAWSMLHGICAGICVQVIMSPIDTALVQVMTHQGAGPAKGLLATMARIFRERGAGGFYAGIVPMLVLTANPGITTMVRELLTGGRRLSARQNFWIGAASKAAASTVTYPITLAKVKLQARRKPSPGNRSHSAPTMLEVLKQVVAVHGVAGLYTGCQVQVGQSVAKEAILNAVRIEIYRFVTALFK